MFEHHSEPLLPFPQFLQRVAGCAAAIMPLIAPSLLVGTLGYKFTENLSWIDAFYNASLILSGMGPADTLQTDNGKIFASIYSLYSGIIVIAVTGILLAPVFHRVLHTFHHKRK